MKQILIPKRDEAAAQASSNYVAWRRDTVYVRQKGHPWLSGDSQRIMVLLFFCGFNIYLFSKVICTQSKYSPQNGTVWAEQLRLAGIRLRAARRLQAESQMKGPIWAFIMRFHLVFRSGSEKRNRKKRNFDIHPVPTPRTFRYHLWWHFRALTGLAAVQSFVPKALRLCAHLIHEDFFVPFHPTPSNTILPT